MNDERLTNAMPLLALLALAVGGFAATWQGSVRPAPADDPSITTYPFPRRVHPQDLVFDGLNRFAACRAGGIGAGDHACYLYELREPGRLLALRFVAYRGTVPVLLPHRREFLVYHRDEELWIVYDYDGNRLAELPFSTFPSDVVVSADSRDVIGSTYIEQDDQTRLFRIDVENRTASIGPRGRFPVFGPGSEQILFPDNHNHDNNQTRSDLFVVNRDWTGLRKLHHFDPWFFSVTVSADGNEIVGLRPNDGTDDPDQFLVTRFDPATGATSVISDPRQSCDTPRFSPNRPGLLAYRRKVRFFPTPDDPHYLEKLFKEIENQRKHHAILMLRRPGQRPTVLSENVRPFSNSFVWSPDGSALAWDGLHPDDPERSVLNVATFP